MDEADMDATRRRAIIALHSRYSRDKVEAYNAFTIALRAGRDSPFGVMLAMQEYREAIARIEDAFREASDAIYDAPSIVTITPRMFGPREQFGSL